MWRLVIGCVAVAAIGCGAPVSDSGAVLLDSAVAREAHAASDSPQITPVVADSAATDGTLMADTAHVAHTRIDTRGARPDEVVRFATSLIGVPYKYGGTSPETGFDCSGFITYVFRHFNVTVPRSSYDFTNVGITVPPEGARPGDLILFTGTTPGEERVGHMGIVVENSGGLLQFAHSTSGKKMSVTITPLNDYYRQRFVRVTRIFE